MEFCVAEQEEKESSNESVLEMAANCEVGGGWRVCKQVNFDVFILID